MYIFHLKPPQPAPRLFLPFDGAKIQKNSINYIFFSLIFAITIFSHVFTSKVSFLHFFRLFGSYCYTQKYLNIFKIVTHTLLSIDIQYYSTSKPIAKMYTKLLQHSICNNFATI